MKPNFFLRLTLVPVTVTSLVFAVACNNNTSSTTTPSGPGPDIAVAQFPTSATGGDPRGTWYPNTPLMNVSASNLSSGVTVGVTFTKNTGSGSIVYTGSTPASGTFSTNNLAASLVGNTAISALGQTSNIPIMESTVGVLAGSGTWTVSGSNLIQFSSGVAKPDTLAFTANSQGLFFVSRQDVGASSGGLFTGIITVALALKK